MFSSVMAVQVTEIVIEGNSHTKDRIILREIQHPIPGEFDESLAHDDRNRIYNLGIFSTVQVYRENHQYKIVVVEGLRVIPFPTVDYDEAKGKKGWSYGLGVMMVNFRGLNEKVYTGFTTGDVNNYFIGFNDPWIMGNHISLGIELYDETNPDAVYAYSINRRHLSVNSGFYRGRDHKFLFTLGYNERNIHPVEDDPDRLPVGIIPYRYRHFYGEFDYRFDTRDIYIDPESGFRLILNVQTHSGVNGSADYAVYRFQTGIWYLPGILPGDGVLSYETVLITQQSRDLPIFQRLYLGGEDFVRGYSPVPMDNPETVQSRMEVSHLFYQSFTWQSTLIPRKDYDGFEAGIDWHVFLDTGTGGNSLKEFRLDRSILGYGAGLVFFTSGFGSVSVDFGFNPYGSGMFIHLADSR